jgi:large subunit ribosomal protein L18e
MAKRTGPTNYQLVELVKTLNTKSRDSAFWARIVKDLTKPARQRRTVNVYKINKYAKEGETIVVPGKVLSLGNVDRAITVAALNFSQEAAQKISQKGGKVITIKQLFEQNPDAKKVRILG